MPKATWMQVVPLLVVVQPQPYLLVLEVQPQPYLLVLEVQPQLQTAASTGQTTAGLVIQRLVRPAWSLQHAQQAQPHLAAPWWLDRDTDGESVQCPPELCQRHGLEALLPIGKEY
ncbi:hypothetical protein HaLaN_16262, partial [Haematococcus lacustris]